MQIFCLNMFFFQVNWEERKDSSCILSLNREEKLEKLEKRLKLVASLLGVLLLRYLEEEEKTLRREKFLKSSI